MKGTQCFRNFSAISNDSFTTTLTAQMGRGKIQWGVISSRRGRWYRRSGEAIDDSHQGLHALVYVFGLVFGRSADDGLYQLI